MKEKSLKRRGDASPVAAAYDEYKAGSDPLGPCGDKMQKLIVGTEAAARSDGGLAKGKFEEHIGRQLRSVYDDVLNQPIPNRFMELLEQLEAPKMQENVRR